MATTDGRARAHALIDELFGPASPCPAADRAVEVLNAQATALAWVRDTTGTYPAPKIVAQRLKEGAARLRDGSDDRDPAVVLGQAAADALAAFRTSSAPPSGFTPTTS